MVEQTGVDTTFDKTQEIIDNAGPWLQQQGYSSPLQRQKLKERMTHGAQAVGHSG
jgi:hypothetical protein